MKWNVNRVFSKDLRLGAIAIAVTGSVAAPAAFAKAANNLLVEPPVHLPDASRQTGEAMFLHETVDGRTLLYIESNQGAELTIFDVTDPGHVKQVREAISDSDTGTTVLPTDGGLYLIRRPAVEMRSNAHQQDVELGIAGAG